MNTEFIDFESAVRLLPDHHVNPMWNGQIVTDCLYEMHRFAGDFGVIARYLLDLKESEVGVIDSLPYTQQVSAYLSTPSVWMLDGAYCAGLRFDQDKLVHAVNQSATRWKTTVDVPAVFGRDGDLKAKFCDFDEPFKSKQRNEQKQALDYHKGYQLRSTDRIPYAFMANALDYWLGQGSSCESAAMAHCWTEACTRAGLGFILHFKSPLGEAYVGIVDIGGTWIFNTFFQGSARPHRIGTAALTAAVNFMRSHTENISPTGKRIMYLAAPRYGEDQSYAVYKSHVANGSEVVGSMFAYHPHAHTQPF